MPDLFVLNSLPKHRFLWIIGKKAYIDLFTTYTQRRKIVKSLSNQHERDFLKISLIFLCDKLKTVIPRCPIQAF